MVDAFQVSSRCISCMNINSRRHFFISFVRRQVEAQAECLPILDCELQWCHSSWTSWSSEENDLSKLYSFRALWNSVFSIVFKTHKMNFTNLATNLIWPSLAQRRVTLQLAYIQRPDCHHKPCARVVSSLLQETHVFLFFCRFLIRFGRSSLSTFPPAQIISSVPASATL